MKNLHVRTITGLLFGLAIAAGILLHPLAFAGLFQLIVLLGLHEFYGLCKRAGYSPQLAFGLISGGGLFLLTSLLPYVEGIEWLMALVIPLTFLPFIIEVFRKKNTPFQNIALSLLGVIYIAVPLSMLNFLFLPDFFEYKPTLLLGFFLLIWMHDTGAYFAGVSLGRHKLCERLSPKKTIEGSIGGLLMALLTALLLQYFFPAPYTWMWYAVAMVCVIAGTFGDLTASMFKRSLGVKDSGSLFPGHGGVIDRFDSVFIAAPMIFVLLLLIS